MIMTISHMIRLSSHVFAALKWGHTRAVLQPILECNPSLDPGGYLALKFGPLSYPYFMFRNMFRSHSYYHGTVPSDAAHSDQGHRGGGGSGNGGGGRRRAADEVVEEDEDDHEEEDDAQRHHDEAHGDGAGAGGGGDGLQDNSSDPPSFQQRVQQSDTAALSRSGGSGGKDLSM